MFKLGDDALIQPDHLLTQGQVNHTQGEKHRGDLFTSIRLMSDALSGTSVGLWVSRPLNPHTLLHKYRGYYSLLWRSNGLSDAGAPAWQTGGY